MTVKKLKQAGKRILAFLMVVIMLVSMAPETVEAYIGALTNINKTDSNEKLRSGTFTYKGERYLYIENKYIHFDICVGSEDSSSLRVGKLCHTIPTAALTYDESGNPLYLDDYGSQVIRFYRAQDVFKPGQEPPADLGDAKNYYEFIRSGNSTGYKENARPEFGFPDENDGISVSTVYDRDTGRGATNPLGTTITTYFTLVKLDKGYTGDGKLSLGYIPEVNIDDTDTSQNWGVLAICEPSGTVKESDCFRMDIEYWDFPAMGHQGIVLDSSKEANDKNPKVSAQVKKGNSYNTIEIAQGMSLPGGNSVIEVFSDAYEIAKPFVAASSQYKYVTGTMNDHGIYGHKQFYARSLDYGKDFTLTAHGQGMNKGITGYVNNGALWGFRDLKVGMTMDEIINFNTVTVGGNKYLYVVKKGNGWKVLEADKESDIPDEAVAYYRGEYVPDGPWYCFRGGAVALSKTVSMSWDEKWESDEHKGNYDVKLKNDGTFSFPGDKVRVSSPTFDIYRPKTYAKSNSIKFKGYDVEENDVTHSGLVLDIEPEENEAILYTALPGNGISVKRAAMNKEGSLEMSGDVYLNMFLANVEMQRLRYNKNMKVDGIEAKGKVRAPGGNANLKILTLSGTEASADISTFKDNEHYDFTLKLSVRDVFTTDANLKLVRLANGELCPDEIGIAVNVTKDGAGLDITPATPVVTLTGGGGVKGLAKQITGSYKSIPPVKVEIKGHGKVYKVLDGELKLTAGPGELSLESSDIGFKVDDKVKIGIIKTLGGGLTVEDYEGKYQGTTYEGYKVGGGMTLDLSIIPGSMCTEEWMHYFEDAVTGKISLNGEAIAAENHIVNKRYSYIGLNGSTSCAFGPEGWELVSGSLDANIHAQGTGPINSSPLQGLTLGGGVAATGSLIFLGWARVMYIIPDKWKEDGGIFGSPTPIDWNNTETCSEILSSMGGMELMCDPVPVTMEDGTKALAVIGTNLYAIDSDVEEVSEADTLENESAEAVVEEEALISAEDEAADTETGKAEEAAESEALSDDILMIAADEAVDNAVMTEDLVADDADAAESHEEAADILGEEAETTGSISKEVTINPTAFNNIPDDQGVVVMVIPKNQDELDSLFNSIDITGLKSSFTRIEPDYDTGYTSEDGRQLVKNSETMNVCKGVYQYGKNGAPNTKCVNVAIAKSQLKDDGKFTVSADNDFTVVTTASAPITGITGTLGSSTLNITVDNPEEDAVYELHTFYGKKEGENDYFVDSRTVSNNAVTQSIELPTSGESIPTGDYYVTTMLTDDAGIPIATYVSDTTIHYANSSLPLAPASVSLNAIGNESLRGTWSEVEDTTDVTVDGYKLKIYQKDDGGEFVDTGRGYDYTIEELNLLKDGQSDTGIFGLAYDDINKTFSIDMAITANGDSVSSNGVAKLEAGKEYKLGVSAYTNRKVMVPQEDGTEVEVNAPAYGPETKSPEKMLAKYEPLSFKIFVDGKELIRNTESKIYEYTGKTKDKAVSFSEFTKEDGTSKEPDKLTVSYTVSGNKVKDHDVTSSKSFDIPDFSGVLQLKVDAVYRHDETEDVTTEYINIEKDDIAPIVALDSTSVITDEDGNYSVKGVTEAGVDVFVDGSKKLAADGNGAFAISGKLTDESVIMSISAVDASGNESETAAVLISKPIEETEDDELFADIGGRYSREDLRNAVTETETDVSGNVINTVTKIWITGLKDKYTYTGSKITPAVSVYDGLNKLTEGKDYTISVKNSTNVSDTSKANGKASLTVKFKGNYNNRKTNKTYTYEITPAVLGTVSGNNAGGIDVVAEDMYIASTGRDQKPKPVVSFLANGNEISKGNFDFTYKDSKGQTVAAVNKEGSYTVTVTPKKNKKNFTGTATAKITVLKAEDKNKLLSSAKIKFNPNKYVYTASPITPDGSKYTVTVKDGKNDKKLTLGTDFEVSFKNNVEPGKATAVFTAVEGSGYYGRKTCTFTITKGRKLLEAGKDLPFTYKLNTISENSIPFVKGGAKPSVTVKDGTKVLTEGVDYTLRYKNNKAVATATEKNKNNKDIAPVVTIKGKGKYKDSVNLKFAITKQDIDAIVKSGGSISVEDKVESNKGHKDPKITIIDSDGKKLKAGTDFAIDGYSEPDTNGVVTANVNGSGNYGGKTKISYRYIKPEQQLSKVSAEKLPDKIYNGEEIILTTAELTNKLYVKNGSQKEYLVPGTAFEVLSYSSNIKKGTAKVTLKGIGKYGGTKTLTFKINAKNGGWKGKLMDGIWISDKN